MEASRKVPDGKLVKISFEEREGKFRNVEIRGDFFIEPPEKLEEFEERIEGTAIEKKEEIIEKLEEVDAELIGFSREDIVKVIEKARGDNDE